MKVTSAEFIKNYGEIADKALSEPVTITRNGRDRLVMLSVEEYRRLARGRRVVAAGELTDAERDAVGKSEVRRRHRHLDKELGDWRP
jgi:prevent-host-death family protein